MRVVLLDTVGEPTPTAIQEEPDRGCDHHARKGARPREKAPRGARDDDRARRQDPRELFATIKGELTVHEIIEEEIFYPELKAHPKAKDIVLEGYQEHHVVDLLMGELEALDVSDETWGAKATVMKENIEHHIEEEEGEMFKSARQVFDRAELLDLGERMERRKRSAKAELNIP